MARSTKAVRVHETGGPDVLRYEDIEVADPGEGEVLLRQTAVGLNFIDIYFRTGLYPVQLPAVLGQEAAGVVEAVGPGVTSLAPGDRVAYAGIAGAYAGLRNVPAARAVKIPEGVTEEQAAALMLKGMTARYLLLATTKVGPGQTIVVHAAAGGTGQILVAWGKHLGAKVIATTGSAEKAELARKLGADHAVVLGKDDLVETVEAATAGAGADVVYDSVGKDTFDLSLASLKMRGLLVSFGQASGPVPPVSTAALAAKCLYLTRPRLHAYIATRSELEETAGDLFAVVRAGIVRAEVGQRFSLADAKDAHRALESRKTTGSTILLPG